VSLRVELTPTAVRQLRRASQTDALALRGVILALSENQHPPGSGTLAGSDLWRVRIRIDGVPWRIVYQIRKRENLVVVARVVRRDEATYRRVP
jgi:mRNA-degrading endonuclease RelE of RelBE toxin-antitoxin system